jgi:4-amino-4-deoxy-L-arabinose transferase-like glycosyltransferase
MPPRSMATDKPLLSAAAVFWILVYLVTAAWRARFPFELEAVEGHCLQQVRRVLDGQPLYVAPSLDFVPLIYTPLYFYVAAAAAWLFGVAFFALRFVSILASIGCLALIFRIVQKQTADSHAALLATGVYAGSYNVAASWFDLARVDSLFLFLLLLTVYSMTFPPSSWREIGTGVLIFASFMTKQTALLACAPLLAYSLWSRPREFCWLAGTLLVLLASSTILFDRAYNGWYSYYVFAVPGAARLRPNYLFRFWTNDMIAPFFSTMLCFAAHVCVGRADKSRRDDWLYYFFLVGAVGASWGGRMHFGGYKNAVMPAYAALAILFGIAVHDFSWGFETGSPRVRLLRPLVALLCLAQFVAFAVYRFPYLPKGYDAAAGKKLQDAVGAVAGDVFLPMQNMLAASVGKDPSAQQWAIGDVMRGPARGRELLGPEITAALTGLRFAAIVADRESVLEIFGPEIDRYYVRRVVDLGDSRAERLFGRPEMYTPRQLAASGP